MGIDRGAVRRLVEMTRSEANEAAPESLLVVPLGATEQHGPHLPVGTDSMLVEAVAERVVLALRDSVPVVLAPTLPVGTSTHHIPFGGTLSMTSLSLYGVLMDIGRSAASGGFRRMFYLNGHGGNHELAQVVARDLGLELPVAVGAGSWWAMAYDALVEAGGPTIRTIPGHAANRVSDGHKEVLVVANAEDKVIHLIGQVSGDPLVGLRPVEPVGERHSCDTDNP